MYSNVPSDVYDEIEEQIKSVVKVMRMKPTTLLDAFRTHDYRILRSVMQEMIYDGTLLLTADRYLELPSEDKDIE